MTNSFTIIPLQELSKELVEKCQQQATGSLLISSESTAKVPAVKFLLLYGRLLYVVEDAQRVRRFRRAIKKYCPTWNPQPISLSSQQPWEYQLLCEGLSQQQIDLAQGKKVIRQVLLEIACSLDNATQPDIRWQADDSVSTELSSGLGLSLRKVEPVFTKAHEMNQQWQKAGLSKISPNFSPVLKKKVNLEALGKFGQYLNGQFTLWDIAQDLGKPPLAITRSLAPLIKKGILQLKQLPDLSSSIFVQDNPTQLQIPDSSNPAQTTQVQASNQSSTSSAAAVNPNGKLIACIDDSPVIAQTLRQILEPAGYRMISVHDPIRGLAEIADHKPDLIFLDLMMPNANGYTVCQFLRNAEAFQRTPIVILTSRDNMLDRSRAKMVGASDFLTKPPKSEETLEVIGKHIGTRVS
ncbi:MAG: response regulator [Microcoleaceae cyanobacterium]